VKDWRVLAEIFIIFKPFYDQIMRLQSRAVNAYHGLLWEVFLSIEYFFNHIKLTKEEYASDFTFDLNANPDNLKLDDKIEKNRKYIKTLIDNCWGKFDEYYKFMDKTPVYAAALVLHLGKRWRYFKRQWIEPHQLN
jgi:hypothetical protein